ADDGIRDFHVTGVQTCALPISLVDEDRAAETAFAGESTVLSPETFPGARVAEVWGWDPAAWLGAKGHRNFDRLTKFLIAAAKLRSEERRVGKGCRCRWARYT